MTPPTECVRLARNTESHAWDLIAEDAKPTPGQRCTCGEMQWADDEQRARTGQNYLPTPAEAIRRHLRTTR